MHSYCKYPAWALNKWKIKQRNSAKKEVTPQELVITIQISRKPYMVIPYYRGLSESLKKICSRHGVQVYCKGGNTIRNLLMAQRTKIQSWEKVGSSIDTCVIGWVGDEEYIGESSRVFGERSRNIKRHRPQPFLTILNYLWSWYEYRKLQHCGRRPDTLKELSKKHYLLGSIIHALNRNVDKFHLATHMG